MLVPSRLGWFAVAAAVVATSGAARAQEVLAPYPQAPPAPIAPAPVAAPPTYVPPPPTYVPPPPIVVPPPSFAGGCGNVTAYPCAPALRYREVERPRYGLMIAGLVVLGASYMPNAFVAIASDEWRLAVPVVGPFFEAHHVDTGSELGNRALVAFLVWDGLVQTAGFVMALAGGVSRHKVRVPDRTTLSFVPTASAQSAGLAAFGRF